MRDIELQHGDVILEKVDKIPEDAKLIKLAGNILEKGEGVHTHVLEPIVENDIQIYEKDGVMFLEVKNPVRLDHEEHGKCFIDEGIYKKSIERTFDYEDMEEKRVRD